MMTNGLKITDPAGTVADETVFPIDYDVRLSAKTTIKKELYGMLKKRTGKELSGDPDRILDPPDKDRHDET